MISSCPRKRSKRILRCANQNLADKKNRLEAHNLQIEKVRTEMRKTYQIYQQSKLLPKVSENAASRRQPSAKLDVR